MMASNQMGSMVGRAGAILGGLVVAFGLLVGEQAKVNAEILTGEVKEVHDADTLKLLVEGKKEEPRTIRLDGIDAPESTQAAGKESAEALRKMVLNKTVKVLVRGTDRYGRTLGIIYFDGKAINTELVRGGWAWHYLEYSDSKVLAKAEREAREAKRGLWAGPASPIAPWTWRSMTRLQAARDKERARLAAEAERQKGLSNGVPPVSPTASGSHWLTSSSGIRHNSSCRYYRKSKGRPCGPNEGRACKICGG